MWALCVWSFRERGVSSSAAGQGWVCACLMDSLVTLRPSRPPQARSSPPPRHIRMICSIRGFRGLLASYITCYRGEHAFSHAWQISCACHASVL